MVCEWIFDASAITIYFFYLYLLYCIDFIIAKSCYFLFMGSGWGRGPTLRRFLYSGAFLLMDTYTRVSMETMKIKSEFG